MELHKFYHVNPWLDSGSGLSWPAPQMELVSAGICRWYDKLRYVVSMVQAVEHIDLPRCRGTGSQKSVRVIPRPPSEIHGLSKRVTSNRSHFLNQSMSACVTVSHPQFPLLDSTTLTRQDCVTLFVIPICYPSILLYHPWSILIHLSRLCDFTLDLGSAIPENRTWNPNTFRNRHFVC